MGAMSAIYLPDRKTDVIASTKPGTSYYML